MRVRPDRTRRSGRIVLPTSAPTPPSGEPPALPPRSPAVMAVGLTLVIAAAVAIPALLSFDPADPPSRHVWPENPLPTNSMGPAGAWLAGELVHIFGLAAWLAVAALGGLGLAIYRQAMVTPGVVRQAVASLLAVTAAAGLLAWLGGPLPLAGIAGPGGLLGAAVSRWTPAAIPSLAQPIVLLVTLGLGCRWGWPGAWNWLFAVGHATLPALKQATRGEVAEAAPVEDRLVPINVLGRPLPPTNQGPPPVAAPPPVRVPLITRPAVEADDSAVLDFGEDQPAAVPVASRPPLLAAPVAERAPVMIGEPPPTKAVRPAASSPPAPAAPAKPVATEPTPTPPATSAPLAAALPRVIRNLFATGDRKPTQAASEDAVNLPSLDLLDEPEEFDFSLHEATVRERATLLEQTFAQFRMNVKVVQIDTGPVITQYEIELEPGLRSKKVVSMADDLALALSAPSIRIVAPIPGKNTVGIEVPNEQRATVCLREVIEQAPPKAAKMRLPLYLGKDVKGQALVFDLADMPHLLIAGRTGTGKSVCLNALILSCLMRQPPDRVKMLMIDPKMVELSLFKQIPHLLAPVVTDPKKAEPVLGWAVEKMDERYSWLARAGVRHIDSYNALTPGERIERIQPESDEEEAAIPHHLPYILIFADEIADLMMTAPKEVEGHIIRLAQKSRAVGIHLVLATQKPTVDVITGLIKSNLPARISFQVASRSDSRVVLDEIGADKLLGMGDMLFLYPGTSKIMRAQGTYVSDQEVKRLTDYLASQAKPEFSPELLEISSRRAPKDVRVTGSGSPEERDDLYDAAVEVIIREQRGSVSLLQRALGVGYGRGARLIDQMAEEGIVGEYNGSQAREVLITPEQWEQRRGGGPAMGMGR